MNGLGGSWWWWWSVVGSGLVFSGLIWRLLGVGLLLWAWWWWWWWCSLRSEEMTVLVVAMELMERPRWARVRLRLRLRIDPGGLAKLSGLLAKVMADIRRRWVLMVVLVGFREIGLRLVSACGTGSSSLSSGFSPPPGVSVVRPSVSASAPAAGFCGGGSVVVVVVVVVELLSLEGGCLLAETLMPAPSADPFGPTMVSE